MPASFQTLATLGKGAIIPADLVNGLRDNAEFLRAPPTTFYARPFADANYTTVSASFVAVDGTNLTRTLVTAGNPVLVLFVGRVSHTTTGFIRWEITVDSSPISNDTTSGLGDGRADLVRTISLLRIIRGLPAASHTFSLQWSTSAATATLHRDSLLQFYVGEILGNPQ